jgi:hypothetical protein
MLALWTTIGLILLAVLTVVYMRARSSDQLEELLSRRKSSAKVASRAELVEGMNHIPVALTFDGSNVFYENTDLQAQLEIKRVDEVEYDTELSIGRELDHGKVLRLRSHGHAFEFILDNSSAARWENTLPAHRMNDPVVTAV